MNREIKFRIWDIHNHLKCYSNQYSLYCANGVISNSVFVDGGKKRFISQQYTGLKDRNGKEIYEGDIVKIEDKEEVRIYDIVFSHGYFGLNRGSKFKHALMYPYTEIIEVIGNIFENPELLK